MGGWKGYEQEGAGEIWILDLKTGKLRFLHSGKVGGGLWDYPVQSVEPSWAKDNKTLVFGDHLFGIEEISILSGNRKTILKPGWGGLEVKLSPTGSWIGFFGAGASGTPLDPTQPMIVASRGGKLWGRVPTKDAPWTMGAWDWHPKQDTLAWVAHKKFDGPCPLYIWDLNVES